MPRIHFYFLPIQFTDDLEDDDDDSQQVCNVSNSYAYFFSFERAEKKINQSGNIGFLWFLNHKKQNKNSSEQFIYCFNQISRTKRQTFKLYNGKKLNWPMFLSNSYYFTHSFILYSFICHIYNILQRKMEIIWD